MFSRMLLLYVNRYVYMLDFVPEPLVTCYIVISSCSVLYKYRQLIFCKCVYMPNCG